MSRLLGYMDETAIHGLMGHKKWWRVYDRRPIEERIAQYKRQMHRLYILKAPPQASKVDVALQTLKQLAGGEGLGNLLEEIARSKGTKWRTMNEEAQYRLLVEAIQEQQVGKKLSTGRDSRQVYETTVVAKEAVDKGAQLIANGWEMVGPMDGHVIFRRRKA
jgi:hypothetical protein